MIRDTSDGIPKIMDGHMAVEVAKIPEREFDHWSYGDLWRYEKKRRNLEKLPQES